MFITNSTKLIKLQNLLHFIVSVLQSREGAFLLSIGNNSVFLLNKNILISLKPYKMKELLKFVSFLKMKTLSITLVWDGKIVLR
jgi:hypothetical protein